MTFPELWRRFHGEALPVGYALRGGLNWVRFHSLPDGKRYAETDDEIHELLRRQNAIAEHVLGNGDCRLVCCLHDQEFDPTPIHQLISKFGMRSAWRPSLADADMDGQIDIFAAGVKWRSGAFDTELLDVANEKLSALWMAELTGGVFAPYDGGVDCILPTIDAMLTLRERFRPWLSPHPLGL